MTTAIDQEARRRLAASLRRLASGRISNEDFEDQRGPSREAALHDIWFHGIWPLYDDLVEHRLVGRWALTPQGRTWVARIVLFLHSGQPYRYPRITGLGQLPAHVLSLFTLGWFGRYWRRRRWKGCDESVWPFHSRSDYALALRSPVFLNGPARHAAQAPAPGPCEAP